MARNEWMRREIATWRAQRIIDDKTAETLLARYPEAKRRPIGAMIAGGIGSLMIGLGVIALLAANWDSFGLGLRTFISIAPTVFMGLVVAWQVARGTETKLFWEPAGVLWLAAIASGVALIAQTYNLGGNVPSFLMTVMILSAPVALITRSVLATSTWAILPCWWMCVAPEGHVGVCTFLVGLVLMLLALVPMTMRVCFDSIPAPGKWLVKLAVTGTTSVILVGWIFALNECAGSEHYGDCIMAGLAAIHLGVAAALLWMIGRVLDWRLFRIAGAGVAMWIGFLTLFGRVIGELATGAGTLFTAGWTVITISLTVEVSLFAVLAALVIWGRIGDTSRFSAMIATAIPVVLTGFVLLGLDEDVTAQLLYLAALGLTAAALIAAVRALRLGAVNVALLMLLVLIVGKFLSSNVSFTVKGIVMILSGIAVMAANIVFVVWRRRVRSTGKEVA